MPPLPGIREELYFQPAIAVASCYAGSVEDGERAVRALREFGTPLVDLVGPTLYVDHQSSIDDTVPHGWHYYWKATDLTGLSDGVIDIIPEQDDSVAAAETAWAREFLHALQPHRAGVYVNFLDSDDDTSRVREAYGDDTYRKLAEVKAKYDPENVFHNNKNIEPGRL